MPRVITTILSIVLLAASSATSRPQSPTAPAKTLAPDFSALREDWASNLHAKHLEASLALYAPDAAFLQPDGTRVEGLTAIRTLFENIMATFDSTIQFTSHSAEQSGNLAFDSGTYTETLTNRATGAALHVSGSYLTIYRRSSDGRWLIIQQAWPNAPISTH